MAVAAPEVHRITLDEYHRWIDEGVFHDALRAELIEGVLLVMSPKGEGHDEAIAWLNERFVLALHGRFQVRPQLGLTFADAGSEPEPDLAVVALDATRPRHPGEALLVIEVAVTSVRYDRRIKAALYAGAGVPELWIVDIEGERVEVRTRPEDGEYREVHLAGAGEVLVPAALGAPEVPVAELLAAARPG